MNFLYTKVLKRPFGELENVVRANKPQRLPVVLSRDEVARLLGELPGPYWSMGSLMYGSGLRLMECLRLQVKDIDLDYMTITVRAGKVNKDRTTIPGRRLDERRPALCTGAEIPQRGAGAGLALSLPCAGNLP